MKSCLVSAVALCLVGAQHALAEERPITISVEGGKVDARNVPILVPLEVSPQMAKAAHAKVTAMGNNELLIGQWTAPGLKTEGIAPQDKGLVRRDLHFVLPLLKAGTAWTFTLEPLDVSDVSKEFHWKEAKGEATELRRGAQPVFRYMHRAYDNSSADKRNKSYKVFHHLFDPTGTRLVTNGGQTDPYTDPKKLLYPHHRGLMFAFNRISYGQGQSADTWHAMPRDTHESHEGTLNTEAGLVLGRHRLAIDWHGPDREVFAKEQREMTVYGIRDGTLLEFATRLETVGGKVRLDGDPQHAGFQFRAANAVAEKTAKETYFLRPDGKGQPGETRNWDPKTKKGPVNLPWDALSFVLDGQRYTVAYLDHPNNPGEKRYSERDYGRFGCYFEYDLSRENPLVLNHRIWLQNGEMTGAQVQALSDSFVAPPYVRAR